MSQRSIIIGSCALLLVVAFALLDRFGFPGDPDPTQGKTLSVVVREGLEADGLRALANAWAERRGVDVQFEALGRGQYLSAVKNEITAQEPAYDVVFFPGTSVAEMAARGFLAEIKYWDPSTDPDLITYSSFDGKVFGLPCDVSTFMTLYRKDLVSQPPESWLDLLEFSNYWPESSNNIELASVVPYGLGIAGKAGEELPKIFYPILWSHGGAIFDDEGYPALHEPEAVAAARLFKRLVTSKGTPSDSESWGVIEIYGAYLDEKIALTTPQWNALFPLFLEDNNAPGLNLALSQIPGKRNADGSVTVVNFQHTWDLVIPNNSANVEAATDFILFATGPEGARLYAKTARGNPARRSVLSDVELVEERPEFPLMLQALGTARREPDVPYYSQLHEIMNDALSRIISGAETPESAFQAASRRLNQVVVDWRE